ncbi:hypothetical protein CO2235_140008 [Cupriavidus oxalaticus]|jgi:hypothetical protein|uniref:Uncharacterized protein n=1 Tax=Cupriavidus oxalaticus TaxID=96344 RepID=A0A375G0F3_9BURK|nr:hypothetical protein CO2235_U920019 [Cupriavidus oxalaticus]SPC12207.1 hypothetical protein CO2235_140008 [Cupriavidus oxalaticus]
MARLRGGEARARRADILAAIYLPAVARALHFLHRHADGFADAFERARAAGTPAVIELMTDPRQLTPAMWVQE